MSNEYLDWMRDGGACGDCVHNIWVGEMQPVCVCALKRDEHKKGQCERFKEAVYG